MKYLGENTVTQVAQCAHERIEYMKKPNKNYFLLIK